MRTVAATLFACLLLPGSARAGAWTRDAGHFYLQASYLHLSATSFYGSDGSPVPIRPYRQDVLSVFAEVGAIDRWLTFTVDGTAYRRNELVAQGVTDGVGDWRLGAWTGLVTKPLRFSLGTTFGIPFGDAHPRASGDVAAQQIAASLPTGSGDFNVEWRLALGYSFGRARRWPVGHYLVVEAGYWLRTAGISDAFVYRVELGTQFPWRFVDRFTVIFRLTGVESFAPTSALTTASTGLGNGVSVTAPGFELYGRIWRGLGAAFAVDGAVRARSLPAADQFKASLSWQY